MSARQWPQASIGSIGRARAVAAAIPGSASVEGVLDAPYDVVWPWVADLQRSVPQFDTQVNRVVVRRRGPDPADAGAERLEITAYSMGIPLGFDVRLKDGFCLMPRHGPAVLGADGGRARRRRCAHPLLAPRGRPAARDAHHAPSLAEGGQRRLSEPVEACRRRFR